MINSTILILIKGGITHMKKLLLSLCVLGMMILISGCSRKEAMVIDPAEGDITEEAKYENSVDDADEEKEIVLELPINDSLSDDIYSFSFKLNGDIFVLPFEFSELEDLGWESKRDNLDEITLNPNQHTLGSELINNGYTIRAAFVNTTENVLSLRESLVGSISIEEKHINSETQIVFPGDITIGSTVDDLIAIHGEPSNIRESDRTTTMTYEIDPRSDIEFRINNETNEITRIQMRNYFVQEEAAAEFEGDLPDAVSNYVAPTDLGNDWESFIVRFDGQLYQLPVPVAVFVENGWIIEDDHNEMIDAQSSNVRVRIRNGNQVMSTTVHNYDDHAQPIAHGFVTVIEYAAQRGAALPIELPGGVTEDSSPEDVHATLGDPDGTAESSDFRTYTFGSIFQRIRITFRIDTNEIHRIEVQHQPRDLD